MKTILLDGIWHRPHRLDKFCEFLNEHLGDCEVWEYDASGQLGIDEVGNQLAEKCREADDEVQLLGYSMGGLIIRSAIQQNPELPVRKTVFANSPHKGSFFAKFNPSPATVQMRPKSEFLKTLDAAPWDIPTMVIWTPGDLMVMPGSSANWEKADETIRNDVPAHIWPLFSKNLQKRILDFLIQ